MRDLTDEDRAAWFDWQVNRRRDLRLWGVLERISFRADASDAKIMLDAMIVAALPDRRTPHGGTWLVNLEVTREWVMCD